MFFLGLFSWNSDRIFKCNSQYSAFKSFLELSLNQTEAINLTNFLGRKMRCLNDWLTNHPLQTYKTMNT